MNNNINNNKKHDRSYKADVLSEVLQLLKLDVRIYHNAKVCGDWFMEDKEGRGPCFHLVTQGRCYLDVPKHFKRVLNEGDLVIFPKSVAHKIYTDDHAKGKQQHLTFTEGANISGTGLLCGDVNFQHKSSQHLLDSLPSVFIIEFDQEHNWLKSLLDIIVKESVAPGIASKIIFDRLVELLFTYAIRHYLETNEVQTSILALYTNEKMIPAIVEIHRDVAKAWTVERLAKIALMSRTAFSEKFKLVSGWTVGKYITWWRMQVAWNLLQNGKSISRVAEHVGYQSEAAFSRAFKKFFDFSPGKLRKSKD